VNKKQWIIAGSIFVILFITGIVVLLSRRPNNTVRTVRDVPVLELAYCSDESAKPCIVSFSTDANDNMLVNILLPDMTFPAFYLKIDHGDGESLYNCQRVRQTNITAYCSGTKLPPGQILHLILISTRDSIVLAQGDLSIIGLAYPTVGIAIPTPQDTPTLPTEAPAPTAAPLTPTALPLLILPTSTEIPPSYPNPSYPNPSYPNPSYP